MGLGTKAPKAAGFGREEIICNLRQAKRPNGNGHSFNVFREDLEDLLMVKLNGRDFAGTVKLPKGVPEVNVCAQSSEGPAEEIAEHVPIGRAARTARQRKLIKTEPKIYEDKSTGSGAVINISRATPLLSRQA